MNHQVVSRSKYVAAADKEQVRYEESEELQMKYGNELRECMKKRYEKE